MNNGAQNITDATETVVAFANEVDNTMSGKWAATGLDSTSFKVTNTGGGVFDVFFNGFFDSSSAWDSGDSARTFLTINGTNVNASMGGMDSNGTVFVRLDVCFPAISFSDGDELQIRVFQNSGSNVNLRGDSSGEFFSWLTIVER